MRRLTGMAALAVLAATTVPAVGGPAAEAPTVREVLRAQLADAAEAQGLDPVALFDAVASVQVVDGNGVVEHRMPVGELIDLVAPDVAMSGPGGTATPAEVNVGQLLHLYGSFGVGGQLRYSVNSSAVVPSTPPVAAPAPPPITAWDAGGPLVQVKGSGWNLVGMHTAGYWGLGNNVDTDGPAPNGDPVHLPARSAAFLDDSSIDFIGHAAVAQGQACLFGLCVAVGSVLGDGATIFDNSTPVSVPAIP